MKQSSLCLFPYIVVNSVLVAQSCPTLCNPVDCSLPGSSVHAILQARILEWIAILFSSGSSQPRDQTQVFQIAGRFFIVTNPRLFLMNKSQVLWGDIAEP